MKFVRTEKEVKDILNRVEFPHFVAKEMLIVSFKTTSKFVKSVLPPPLKPTVEPTGTMTIGTFTSNSVGDFNGASIRVGAVWEDYTGVFCLSMPMSTDTAIIFGRETIGEPKKQADINIVHEGDKIVGTVFRLGEEFMRLTATPTGTCDPGTLGLSHTFHYKYTFAADGSGLDFDPKLTCASFLNQTTDLQHCNVECQLGKTEYDVFGDVPVEEIISGLYARNLDITGSVKYLTTIPKKDFLPYAFFKVDPWDIFQ